MSPGADDRWFDREAGPVVRPYAVTRGRTRPRTEQFDLICVVVATGMPPPDTVWLGPEQMHVLGLCRRPITIADVASDIDLPLGVVRVLLSDLNDHGLLSVLSMPQPREVPDVHLLRKVLNGLKAL
ncbi:MAG TPA: DUF742 domain-containing protein [Streptosporangiaceae bacterium]|jgi:hypothetical protein